MWWGKETALDQHLYNLYNSISPPSQSLSNLIEKKTSLCHVPHSIVALLIPLPNSKYLLNTY